MKYDHPVFRKLICQPLYFQSFIKYRRTRCCRTRTKDKPRKNFVKNRTEFDRVGFSDTAVKLLRSQIAKQFQVNNISKLVSVSKSLGVS